MKEARQHLARLERILKVRQIAVDEAEARIRECEFRIRRLETQCDAEQGRIRQTMEEFAHADGQTGFGLQRSEKVIQTGRSCLARILQDIERLRTKLEDHRVVWRETRREYKRVEKLREHKLQRLSREERFREQKVIDDVSISSHRRKTEIAFER